MSETTFFELGGNQYKVELVEADNNGLNNEQSGFVAKYINTPFGDRFTKRRTTHGFYSAIYQMCVEEAWGAYLISEARKRGFIYRCQIKTATDMDKMKSDKMQLIGLSKLAVCGRKQIIIYDNGKWCAEAIPEVKKRWFVNDTLNIGKQLSREDMAKVKCEPEKQNIGEVRKMIIYLTKRIDSGFEYTFINKDDAKLIREILNNYLNK